MSSPCSGPLRPFFRPALAAALLALAATGCGGRRGDVSGKVTYQGKALVWGTVQFEGSDGTLRQANIGSDGRYTVRGVTAGGARVAVSSLNPKGADFQARQGPRTVRPKLRANVAGWFPIPPKYDTPFNSGLTYTIKGGRNTIDIDLK